MTKKSTPFLYPQSKHRRKFSPEYKTNTSYKPYLREEFNKKCVYCCMPDFLKKESFGVDHYRPKIKFRELEWEYSNLFYACNACNSRKGDSWPTEEQLKAKIFIPNPCDHIMFNHLKFSGIKVETRSNAGKYADEILDLNDDDILGYREQIVNLIENLMINLKEYEKTISDLNNLLKDIEKEKVDKIEKEKELLNEKAFKIKEILHDCGIKV